MSPPLTQILVFTDEPGNDQSLADAVIAQAKDKRNRINVIYSAEGFA